MTPLPPVLQVRHVALQRSESDERAIRWARRDPDDRQLLVGLAVAAILLAFVVGRIVLSWWP